MTTLHTSTLLEFPRELLHEIISVTAGKPLLVLGSTCKTLCEIVKGEVEKRLKKGELKRCNKHKHLCERVLHDDIEWKMKWIKYQPFAAATIKHEPLDLEPGMAEIAPNQRGTKKEKKHYHSQNPPKYKGGRW
jgi:hypothetical protein